MASVTLGDFWINLGSDLSQHVVLRRQSSAWSRPQTGDVRQYAAGRSRAVLKGGRTGTTTLHVRTTDFALVDTLHSWVGQRVFIRDERGRSAWGVYFDVPETDAEARRVEFDLTIQHVSFDPAV